MPPLPPKPKVPLLAEQALVVAALATTACAGRIPPRIGQPPPLPEEYRMPVRIGAETCPDVPVTDTAGQPVVGARVTLQNGIELTTDAGGLFAPRDHLGPVTVEHPDYAAASAELDCSGQPIVLAPANRPDEPVRIGAVQADDPDVEADAEGH